MESTAINALYNLNSCTSNSVEVFFSIAVSFLDIKWITLGPHRSKLTLYVYGIFMVQLSYTLPIVQAILKEESKQFVMDETFVAYAINRLFQNIGT